MKTLLYPILICLIFSATALAQPQSRRVQALKTEYLNTRIRLTTDEARRFWPVYHRYERDLQELLLKRRDERLAARREGGPSNTVDELQYETAILTLRKSYKQQFARILPADKVKLVFQAEREFRDQLLQELRRRRARQ
jgi:hypothetical protein